MVGITYGLREEEAMEELYDMGYLIPGMEEKKRQLPDLERFLKNLQEKSKFTEMFGNNIKYVVSQHEQWAQFFQNLNLGADFVD